MATLITMPAIVADASSALLATWLVAPGGTVATGQPLVEIETDKATVEYEAEASGILARVIAAEGQEVPVGAPIAVLAASGDSDADIDQALAAAGQDAAAPAAEPEASETSAAEPVTQTPATPGAPRIFSSPLARRLAREHGVPLDSLQGSGPAGRILRGDVQQAIDARTAVQAAPAGTAVPAAPTSVAAELPAGAQRVELTRMRKAIARRLSESKSTVPHFYLSQDIEVDQLLALRKQLKETTSARITVNDLILKAVARALVEVPQANACWAGDSITQFSTADISVAIATPTGLVTPVLHGVESLSLGALSAQVADFAARARDNQLSPAELAGGSFTVSNLGMFGTRQFTAILNPPQAGILAVGAAEQRPVVREGSLAVATVMTCTLSADHRVMDGAVAAELLASITKHLEQPLGLLV